MSRALLDQFTAEFGVEVEYQTYANYEDAVETIRSGSVVDVLLIGNDALGALFANALLAPMTPRNIPNLINIDIYFSELDYDPGNEYLAPYLWGTTGILARSDFASRPLTTWNDLWDMQYGKTGWWLEMRTMIGLTLISLGYSPNTSDPAQLEAALDKLIRLKEEGVELDQFGEYSSAARLADGMITMAVAWAYDDALARELGVPATFIIPAEGALLWIESLVIPTTAREKATAEVFINYMLRPENMAMFANEFSYAVTSSLANPYIDPAILENEVIYPNLTGISVDTFLLPLDEETRQLYEDIWRRFLLA